MLDLIDRAIRTEVCSTCQGRRGAAHAIKVVHNCLNHRERACHTHEQAMGGSRSVIVLTRCSRIAL